MEIDYSYLFEIRRKRKILETIRKLEELVFVKDVTPDWINECAE